MRWFAVLLILAISMSARATEYTRVVSLEWEQIENAKTYEFELTPIPLPEGEKPYTTKITGLEWSGPLAPGTYSMRIRSKDKRSVPGDWSTPEEFKVNLENAKLMSPKPQEILKPNESKETEVSFQWEPVGGAKEYLLEVKSEDGAVNSIQTVKDSKINLKILVAKKYTWKVQPRASDTVTSDASTVTDFTIVGKKLDAPKINKPESEYVREVRWFTPENAENFDYLFSRWNPKLKKWEQLMAYKEKIQTEAPFEAKWPGGKYRFVVRAKATLRETSDKTEVQFRVVEGNRSPATEYTQTMRQSIDRTSGYFAIASYLLTMIDFKGINRDKGGATTFQSLGGTGRLGLGFQNTENPLGFLGIIDLSGFNVDGKNFTFASVEVNAVYRQTTSERGQARHSLGPFYKQLPDIQGNGLAQYTGTGKIAAGGPHYGYEYWYAVTPKMGAQLNGHLYYNMFKSSTPNGQPILPSTSIQLGLLGSYRLSPTMTGLMGYAYRFDSISYRATSGDTNSVEIKGHYLNLFLEWAL